MFDETTWLRAVRRVSRPGMRRNEIDLEVDSSVLYNPATRRFRRNPEDTGRLQEAPAGAAYRIGVAVPGGRFALERRDEDFVIRLGLRAGDPVRVTFDPEDQFATIQRAKTLAMNGRCDQCWRALDGDCQCQREIVSNPQLQILGDYTRRNPAALVDANTAGALKRFHGKVTGDVISEYDNADGGDDVIDLAYLGHCPAIAWLSDERGSANKQIDVNGELVRFRGFRKLFRGRSRPILTLSVPTNEAVLVQGTVESLRDRCDSRGVLGFSPVVEYIVDAVKNSSKGSYHYVHEFAKDYEPVLRWDDALCGLVYDRDRTLMSSGRKAANPRFNKTAVYEVSDWFHEKDIRRHGER